MLGAIIGDLCGSIYEFGQFKNCHKVKMKKVIENNAFFSDDTIMTIAVLDAIINQDDYAKCLRKYVKEYKTYLPDFDPYFKTIFSTGFSKWAESKKLGISMGNGAMMRISPIGFMFQTEEEVIENAYLATIPSHNSEEAIKYAKLIALIIFYARKGLSKKEIVKKLDLKIKKPKIKEFNYTCPDTIGVCLYSAFKAKNFENAMKLTLSFGGDTDTNCAIVGGMAEALYGIDYELKKQAMQLLPERFCILLTIAYKILENN